MPRHPAVPEAPALREARDIARDRLRTRIQKGQELKGLKVQTEEEAEAFDKEYGKWNDYNEELLTALFTTGEYRLNYRWSVSTGASIADGSESHMEKSGRLREYLDGHLTYLESLLERIEIIPLAPGVRDEPSRSGPMSADAIWPLIHKKVLAIARRRFDDGHYADAVEAAFKALNAEVKALVKSRVGEEKDGPDLMHYAFSPKAPVVTLMDLSTQSGRDMQQGFMEMFAGAMSAIRNPKAHDNVVIGPERAIHLLFVASTLWHTLDARI